MTLVWDPVNTSKTAARGRHHLVDMAKFKCVLISSIENIQWGVLNGDAWRRRKTATIHVQRPRTVHHPHEGVVRQVYPIQIPAVAGASSGTVASLKLLRCHDPRPVQYPEVHQPAVLATVSVVLRHPSTESLVRGSGLLGGRAVVPRPPWSECSSRCPDVGNHVLVDDENCQNVFHVCTAHSAMYRELQSTTITDMNYYKLV